MTTGSSLPGEHRPDGDDDEALTWGDERDASHVAARGEVAPTSDADEGPQVMGSGALVAHGVLGGAFLLSAVGWLVSAGRFAYVFPDAGTTLLWRLGVGLAVLAPVLWFTATLVLVPARRTRRRLLVLVVGVLLVAPWPAVVGGLA